MKTTVEITDSLLAEAKQYAASKSMTLRQVIELGLREIVQSEKPRKRFRLRKHSFRGDGLVRDFDWPSIRDEIYTGRGT